MGEAHGGFVLVILSCEPCPWLKKINFKLVNYPT